MPLPPSLRKRFVLTGRGKIGVGGGVVRVGSWGIRKDGAFSEEKMHKGGHGGF